MANSLIMKRNPKISVITPCFNHGKYILEMIDSLLAQTFLEFEIIIVNDGSTDNTKEILDLITHKKISIIHTENHGPAHARNLAIKNASAPIIMNLDADDKIEPILLEKAYKAFENNPEVGIVYCDTKFFGAKTGLFSLHFTTENMLFSNRIVSNAFFYKKDWQQVGGYSDELIYACEDWDFWLSIIELGRSVVKIPEALVHYRTYNSKLKSRSGRSKISRIKLLETNLMIFQRHQKLYASYPRAWEYFSQRENKYRHEFILIKLMKNFYFKYFKPPSHYE